MSKYLQCQLSPLPNHWPCMHSLFETEDKIGGIRFYPEDSDIIIIENFDMNS